MKNRHTWLARFLLTCVYGRGSPSLSLLIASLNDQIFITLTQILGTGNNFHRYLRPNKCVREEEENFGNYLGRQYWIHSCYLQGCSPSCCLKKCIQTERERATAEKLLYALPSIMWTWLYANPISLFRLPTTTTRVERISIWTEKEELFWIGLLLRDVFGDDNAIEALFDTNRLALIQTMTN